MWSMARRPRALHPARSAVVVAGSALTAAHNRYVIPAQAGTQDTWPHRCRKFQGASAGGQTEASKSQMVAWVPACAGMTLEDGDRCVTISSFQRFSEKR